MKQHEQLFQGLGLLQTPQLLYRKEIRLCFFSYVATQAHNYSLADDCKITNEYSMHDHNKEETEHPQASRRNRLTRKDTKPC